jgi:hypothetical protein
LLRREGYDSSVVPLSEDERHRSTAPTSEKDTWPVALEEWVPLRGDDWYAQERIDLKLATAVAEIDTRAREVALAGGRRIGYDRLLLATGAEPVRLPLPGMDLPHVHTLRSLADCRAIIARAATPRRVVLGRLHRPRGRASLRARGVEVHVVAPGTGHGPRARPAARRLRARPARGARGGLPPGDTASAIDARR